MRPSVVVHIRVGTEDVMAAIDIVKNSGMATAGMSLAMVIKLAFSAAMESLRAQGVVPQRDGWEYTDMVAPLLRDSMGRKVQVSQAFARADMNRAAMDMPVIRPTIQAATSRIDKPEVEFDAAMHLKARKLLRHKELSFQHKHERENMTSAEVQEFQQLCEELGLGELV